MLGNRDGAAEVRMAVPVPTPTPVAQHAKTPTGTLSTWTVRTGTHVDTQTVRSLGHL